MAGCASSCASRSQASPMLTLRRFQKTEKCQIFRKPPFRVFAYHVGLTVATFSVAHVGVLGSLSHPFPFVHGTMWAGFLRVWDCGVHIIVLCVIRGLEPSLLLFLAISSQGRQRPHYYLVTLLSRLISSPVRLLTRPPPRWCLPAPLAPQL